MSIALQVLINRYSHDPDSLTLITSMLNEWKQNDNLLGELPLYNLRKTESTLLENKSTKSDERGAETEKSS